MIDSKEAKKKATEILNRWLAVPEEETEEDVNGSIIAAVADAIEAAYIDGHLDAKKSAGL